MISEIETSRLAGAAARMSRAGDDVDREFLVGAKGSMSRYLFATSGTPAGNARRLVSAGLVSPNDPCAVALQDIDGQSPAGREAWIAGADLRQGGLGVVDQLMAADADRNVRVSAAALSRRMRLPGFGHEEVAAGFEDIAQKAAAAGCKESAMIAGRAFAQTAVSGVERRDRGLEMIRPQKRDGREIE